MKTNRDALFAAQAMWIFLFVAEVIVGGLPIEHLVKIELSVGGGLLLGLLMTIRIYLLQKNTVEMEAINSNAAEARKLIRGSVSRIVYQPLLGRDVRENEMSSKAKFDLADNIKSLVSIFLCFSVSMVLWIEPMLIEFSFFSSVPTSVLVKQVALQILYVLLISTGFAGIFLNLTDKFFKRGHK